MLNPYAPKTLSKTVRENFNSLSLSKDELAKCISKNTIATKQQNALPKPMYDLNGFLLNNDTNPKIDPKITSKDCTKIGDSFLFKVLKNKKPTDTSVILQSTFVTSPLYLLFYYLFQAI